MRNKVILLILNIFIGCSVVTYAKNNSILLTATAVNSNNYGGNPLIWRIPYLDKKLVQGFDKSHSKGKDISEVNMANGIKIGEVSQNSAIIWTRLTKDPERKIKGEKFLKKIKRQDWANQPIYDDLSIMEGSVIGEKGEVRLEYWADGKEKMKVTTKWIKVDEETDFIHHFSLKKLKPGTKYHVVAIGRKKDGGVLCKMNGVFSTAPSTKAKAEVSFVVTTCGDYPRRDDKMNGHIIYKSMLEFNPDFLVHAGDAEYYDRPEPLAINKKLARFKWNRIYSMPYLRTFHNQVPAYFMKDDHDVLKDDCWPGTTYGDLTFKEGLAIHREQIPMSEKPYRTFRWGKNVQVWLVEGREFRSPNRDKDGPDKTIWGKEQKKWFFETVKASDATFKVLLSATPIVGPDRDNKKDNHANSVFKYEGDEIREFVANQKNMYIICGDRHWQYASIDPKTGVREFSCGPASEKHAGGYKEEADPEMHKYLNVVGGFLRVSANKRSITFTHHAVDGSINNLEEFIKK